MSLQLKPKAIVFDVTNKKLSKAEATEKLVSIIEESSDYRLRSIAIKAMGKVGILNEKTFKFLENCLVSDESSLVRSAAVKVLSKRFFNVAINPLIWAVNNERSAIVLKTILQVLDKNDDHQIEILRTRLVKRLENIYDVKKEVQLFLNLEVLYAEFSREYDLKAGISWYKTVEMLINHADSIGLISRLNYLKLGGIELIPLPKKVNSLHYLRKIYHERE